MKKRLASIALSAIFAAAALAGPVSAAKSKPNSDPPAPTAPQPKGGGGGHMHW
jgi:hypothetical protein